MRVRSWILMLACAAVVAWAAWQAGAVGNHLQYLALAPQPEINAPDDEKEHQPNEWITDWEKRLASAAEEWAGSIRSYSMDGIVESAALSTDKGGMAQARLTLLGEGGQRLRSLLLRSGRLFSPDELKYGEPVILLDEDLALALFRIGEPIDQQVMLEGSAYRVVGILRHTRRVGERTLYGAYIPLRQAVPTPLVLDAVQVEAQPVPGTGASAVFASVIATWHSGGTLTDLGKEGMGAWLWLRVLIFLAGMAAVLRIVRLLNRQAVLFYREWRQRLQGQYALHLLPWAAGRAGLLGLGYGACAGGFALLMTFILQPVYIFPEWIPAILVEWSDIQEAFWKVWGDSATLIELRSPELNRLRFLTLLVDGFSALLGVLYFRWWSGLETPTERVAAALPAMRRQRMAVSVLRTARPLPLEDLGYTRLEGDWLASRAKKTRHQTAMLRIVDVRRVLSQLPPSDKEGAFVLEVFDPQIAANNLKVEIVCDGEKNIIRDARRDWDMRCSAETLARIIYGQISLDSFLESRVGVELHMRSAAMDGFFAHHLREDGRVA